jgi:hypothetical protein
MPDWTDLSIKDRAHIEHNLTLSLNHLGIKGALTRWSKPSKLPHWQLVIQTSWCVDKQRNAVAQALDQAMARADIQAPLNGIILRGPPEN